MKNKNSTKEKNKYLTYEDIQKKYQEARFFVSFSFEKMNDKDYIEEIDNLNIDVIILKLADLSEYQDIKFFNDYSNLFDNKGESNYLNKCRLLSRLLAICENRVYSPNTIHVDYEHKIDLLKKSFEVFKLLENPASILNDMFNYEHKYPKIVNVFDILLNEKECLKYLMYFSDYRKQNPEYNTILKDFFPNMKNNER